ncbi:MAG TPA: hypothetical protein DCS21_02815 [Gammaproteobacteria bacterium]|nr:hypothetical protein [Gammaproteobacteria bacterium]
MENVVIFNDYANVNRSFQQHGVSPDYRDLLKYLSEGRFLVEAHAYVPIDPRNPHVRDREIEQLWSDGYLVHSKMSAPAGDTYKCDFDVEITLDLMRTAEIVRPAIIVLVSGDKDFIPVILELRQRGIRVEVAAFPGVNAAREVIMKASGFIDLEHYLVEPAPTKELQNENAQADENAEDFPLVSHDAPVWKP